MSDEATRQTELTGPTLYFHHAGLTNTGQLRDHNEDAYNLPPEVDPTTLKNKGYLYVLADGMGGHQKGEVASAVTIEIVPDKYYTSVKNLGNDPEKAIIQALTEAIEEANLQVMDATEGGGTTIVAAVLHSDSLVVMNVGDSRAYLLRDDQLRLISRDHSLVQRLVEMGKITEEESLNHPRRNVLYQALGQGPDLEIFVSRKKLKSGDIIILCSDGLWGEVDDPAIKTVLNTAPSPVVAVEELINLANASGGPDNITAIIIQVSDQKNLPETNADPESGPAELDDTEPSFRIKPKTLPEGKYHTGKNS